MRLFILLLALHALIHLIAVVPAKDGGLIGKSAIATGARLTTVMKVLWLLAFVLFAFTAMVYGLHMDWWWIPAIVSITLSQVLIILWWPVAKAGTLANVLILLVSITAFGQWQFFKTAGNETKAIIHNESNSNAVVTGQMLRGLPLCVQKWLKQSGTIGKPLVHKVYLKQKGRMRIKPNGKWLPVHAEQYFNVDEPAFVWMVKVNMNPGMVMTGRDKFSDGNGHMLIKLYGLFKIVDEKSSKIDQGAMLRYMGEICWFPSAALQPYFQWKEIDSCHARLTMQYKQATASAIFSFDTTGRIVAVDAMRYMGGGRDARMEKWVIPARNYSSFNGISVMSEGDAIWQLKTGNYNYYRWQVTDIKYDEQIPAVAFHL